MRTLKELFTAEELERLPSNGERLELVKGNVYELAPAGGRHGYVAARLGMPLSAHVWQLDLGHVFAAETGFILRRDPDTVRAPDVAFISSVRMRAEEIPDSFIELVPDLVVEVVSPGDSRREVEDKVQDWLTAGVRLAWVIYPATRSATVYHHLNHVSNLAEDDLLDGEEVVPGFTCRVGDLFA